MNLVGALAFPNCDAILKRADATDIPTSNRLLLPVAQAIAHLRLVAIVIPGTLKLLWGHARISYYTYLIRRGLREGLKDDAVTAAYDRLLGYIDGLSQRQTKSVWLRLPLALLRRSARVLKLYSEDLAAVAAADRLLAGLEDYDLDTSGDCSLVHAK